MKVMAKGNEPCCTPPFQLNEQKQFQKISIHFSRTVDIILNLILKHTSRFTHAND